MEEGRGERSEEEQGRGEVQGWVEVQAEWEVQAGREDRKEEGESEDILMCFISLLWNFFDLPCIVQIVHPSPHPIPPLSQPAVV